MLSLTSLIYLHVCILFILSSSILLDELQHTASLDQALNPSLATFAIKGNTIQSPSIDFSSITSRFCRELRQCHLHNPSSLSSLQGIEHSQALTKQVPRFPNSETVTLSTDRAQQHQLESLEGRPLLFRVHLSALSNLDNVLPTLL